MSDQAKIILSGVILKIFDATINGRFEKREMWLKETSDQYPQTWKLEFQQGNCNLLDQFSEGDVVTCHVNLRGVLYQKNGQDNVFNSMVCWKIINEAPGRPARQYRQAASPAYEAPAADTPETDDLPF